MVVSYRQKSKTGIVVWLPPAVEKDKLGAIAWSPPAIKKTIRASLCGHFPKQGCYVVPLFQRMLSDPSEDLIWRKSKLGERICAH